MLFQSITHRAPGAAVAYSIYPWAGFTIAANSNAAVNAATRVLYALARNRLAPGPFGHVHARFKTPYVATIWMSASAFILSLLLGWKWGPLIGFSLIATLPGDRGRDRLYAHPPRSDLGLLDQSRTRPSHPEVAHYRLSRDQVIWSFGPDLQPALAVDPGDVVTFETNDCFTGQIRSEEDLVTSIDMSMINGATGPVAVKGAEPGDSLVAEILDVRPIEWGVATLIPGFGQLIEQVQSPLTRMFEVKDGRIRQNERIAFPARPMVGVVGVATGGEELSNGLAGLHGGNLDDHLHGKGARIFFPVRQTGGMFAVGDMHASMGDGEICFTGVEIAGEVDVRFELLKGKQSRWPVTELADRWLPHATAPDYAEALSLVSEEAARLLVDEHGFSIEDAFIFLSVACDAGVAQACKPAPGFGMIARFSIPKIDACPAPFAA